MTLHSLASAYAQNTRENIDGYISEPFISAADQFVHASEAYLDNLILKQVSERGV